MNLESAKEIVKWENGGGVLGVLTSKAGAPEDFYLVVECPEDFAASGCHTIVADEYWRPGIPEFDEFRAKSEKLLGVKINTETLTEKEKSEAHNMADE